MGNSHRTARPALEKWSSPVFCLVIWIAFCPVIVTGCSNKPVDGSWKNLTAEEKIEDFRYLVDLLEENHPYLTLKARAEGYDWVEHIHEFEKAVEEADDDKAFAQAIVWMLSEINNAHTNILHSELALNMAEWNRGSWKKAVARSSPERMDYWYALAARSSEDSAVSNVSVKGKYPPFMAMYCGGRYVVVAVAPEEPVLSVVRVGMTVVEVDGQPVEEYVKGLRGLPLPRLYRLRNDSIRRHLYQHQLMLPVGGESLRVTLEGEEGVVHRVQVPYAEEEWGYEYPLQPRYGDPEGYATSNIYTDILASGRVAYIQFRDLMGTPEDAEALKRFFESVRDLPAIIIDIRGNPGGKSTYYVDIVSRLTPKPIDYSVVLTWRGGSYVQDFAKEKMALLPHEKLSKSELVTLAGPELAPNIPAEILTEEYVDPCLLKNPVQPNNSISYEGKVFLLVDDICYSAADGFASFCRATGFATVVGTWTGGDGLALTPALAVLPNSGMVVRFPLTMGLNPDFTANEETQTVPDVFVEPSVEDMVKFLEKYGAGQATGGSAGGSGLFRPDPDCDTVLRKCLELAVEAG